MKNFLLTVVGPTAVGKTSVAIQLGQHYQCDILSFDSRQFYREMSIGTAKPTHDELSQCTHHFINNLSITQAYSAGQFEREGLDKLNELYAHNNLAVAVGGSGLYLDGLCKGFDDLPQDSLIREELIALHKEQGIQPLQETLKALDPNAFSGIDNHNPHRLMRAIEVCKASGKKYSTLLGIKASNRKFKTIAIGIEMDREALYEKINTRVDLMIDAGLVDEVVSLTGYTKTAALQTVGYAEIFDYLSGIHDLPRAIELIKRNSRRYAKRQITWFKKNEAVVWFNPNDLHLMINHIDNQRI